MIPASWGEERAVLAQKQRDQQVPDRPVHREDLVTDEDFAALAATPITTKDLAELVDTRGQYALGDTRGFVEGEELRCAQWNCWMVRRKDGAVQYLSEVPGAHP